MWLSNVKNIKPFTESDEGSAALLKLTFVVPHSILNLPIKQMVDTVGLKMLMRGPSGKGSQAGLKEDSNPAEDA